MIRHHRIGKYKINQILLSCFDEKIFIQKSGYDGLTGLL